MLLALVALTTLGLALELLLLEHFDSATQWIPLVLLGAVLVACIAVVATPGRRTIRVFQLVMALCVVAGVIGIYLHYRGNVEFELEQDPGRRGLALLWEAIRGATPTFAAGALSQLGLLGLAYTYRHPALYSRSTVRDGTADTHHTERS